MRLLFYTLTDDDDDDGDDGDGLIEKKIIMEKREQAQVSTKLNPSAQVWSKLEEKRVAIRRLFHACDASGKARKPNPSPSPNWPESEE